jgi:uncharacterized protein
MTALRHPRSQRIDIVRGIAVFGILLINVWGFIYGHGLRFGVPGPDASLIDQAVIFFCSAFADSKARPLFAFLFGAGFSLLMDRLCQGPGGIDAAKLTYQRRIRWLLACGVLHGVLLWAGDILTWYALIGFWLLRFAGQTHIGPAAESSPGDPGLRAFIYPYGRGIDDDGTRLIRHPKRSDL